MSLTQIAQDWRKPLQAPCFVGYIPDPGEKDPSGTVLRCITTTRVPCSQDASVEHNVTRVSFAVLKIIKRGWMNVPYKRPKALSAKNPTPAKYEKDPNAKPVFEECVYANREALKVYNYAKASAPSDKGASNVVNSYALPVSVTLLIAMLCRCQ